MKGIIRYKIKYGAMRQYAEWVGQELKLPVLVRGSLDVGYLLKSDFIVSKFRVHGQRSRFTF